MSRRILYFADPMCSWCWGFAPVIDAIATSYGDRAPVRFVAGGLRAGQTQPMDEATRSAIRHHWADVHARTGQPFDDGFFERTGFVYDTEPACRAVVAVRSLEPAAALAFLHAVQHAFYARNRDVTREETLADVAGSAGLDRDAFLAVFSSPEVADATRADFTLTATLGVPGFPAILLQDGTRYAWLTQGYQPLDDLSPALDHWLATPATG